MGERESNSMLNQKCTDTIFFKIDNRIIESPNRKSYPLSFEKKEFDTCRSSISSPIKAEEVTFNSNKLDIPNNNKKLEFQILLSSSLSHRKNLLNTISEDLKKEKKTIKDLKKVGSFYEHGFYKIAESKILTGIDGNPMIYEGSPRNNSMGAHINFVWKDGILVRIFFAPHPLVFKENLENVYPYILKYLNEMDKTS